MTIKSGENRDNASGADNQQERPFDWYLTGFADGEGSFNVSFKRESNYGMGWKVALSFNISQRDASILYKIKRNLGCGTVRFRRDGVGYYEVRDHRGLQDVIIPFFQRHQLLTKKRDDFEAFRAIASIVFAKRHLTRSGMEELLSIRSKMNGGGKRKFTDDVILGSMKTESSETIRQTATEQMI